MFTIEEIKAAHAKVKSGADFPEYIKQLKKLGVTSYTTYVSDGRTLFDGTDDNHITSAAKYPVMSISSETNAGEFKEKLKAHQIGQTDYLTFCNNCATNGVEKWVVNTIDMTCIYYNTADNEVLTEQIPQA